MAVFGYPFGHVAVLPVLAEPALQLSADGDRVAGPVGDFGVMLFLPVFWKGARFVRGVHLHTFAGRARSFLLG